MSFTPEQITEILQIYFDNFVNQTYTGMRYVPIIGRRGENSAAWDNSEPYEPLTIVTYNNESYTSRQFVPAAADIADTDYWVKTGAYNAQIVALQDALPIAQFDSVNTVKDYIDELGSFLPASDFDNSNTVKAYIDATNDLLPASDFDSVNTVKAYIDGFADILPSNAFDSVNTVRGALNGRVRAFETVADMAAATDLAADMICHTNGFHTSGDGGAAFYEIKASGTANAMDIIACQDSLLAHLVITEPFVTPEQFGAYGDGTHDDTSVLQYVLKYCSDNKKQTVFANKYIITDALNKYNGSYVDLNINIKGAYRNRPDNYNINAGGIKLDAQGSIFENAAIEGNIDSMVFVGARDDSYLFFFNCSFRGRIEKCAIWNFGTMFLNTLISGVTTIVNNRFLSVFNFIRLDKDATNTYNGGITDSIIANNYINGGAEPTDNAFIECDGMNGCIVANNFVDYYKVMYRFKKYASGAITWQGGVSCGNQYQVFLYFYNRADGQSITSISFNSVSDSFNWTSETAVTTKAKFDLWTRDKYTGRDNNQYDTPNYIFRPFTGMIRAKNAIIQSNVGNYIFSQNNEITTYDFNAFDIEFAGTANHLSGATKIAHPQGGSSCYNNGQYKENKSNFNIITVVDSLPTASMGWTKWGLGYKISYNHIIYECTAVYDSGTSTWSAKWLDRFGTEAS